MSNPKPCWKYIPTTFKYFFYRLSVYHHFLPHYVGSLYTKLLMTIHLALVYNRNYYKCSYIILYNPLTLRSQGRKVIFLT